MDSSIWAKGARRFCCLRSAVSAALVLCVVWTRQPASAADEPAKTAEKYQTRLFLADSDGSNMKPLVIMPEYVHQGSPSWSRDGKQIAMDSWKEGGSVSTGEVVVVNADGTKPRVLGDGLMPTFSPQGTRIAYMRNKEGGGVWVMSAEGPDKENVQIDESGWGADWAADGRLVYGTRTPGGANLVVFDLVEGTRRYLFDEQQSPYQHMYWNMAWSPDGKRIAFKAARKDGTLEIGIVDARGEKSGLVHRYEGPTTATLSWNPDQSRVLITKACAERENRMQIYFFNPDTTDAPQLLPGQEPNRNYSDTQYSPDGKQIVISAGMPVPPKKPATEKAAPK